VRRIEFLVTRRQAAAGINPHKQPTSGIMHLHASGRRKTLRDSKVKVYQDQPPCGLGGNDGSLVDRLPKKQLESTFGAPQSQGTIKG
jgi:hypothetical protein